MLRLTDKTGATVIIKIVNTSCGFSPLLERCPRGLAYGAHGRYDSATVPKEFEAAVFPVVRGAVFPAVNHILSRNPLRGTVMYV